MRHCLWRIDRTTEGEKLGRIDGCGIVACTSACRMDIQTLVIAVAGLVVITLLARRRKAQLRYRASPLGQAAANYVHIQIIDESQDKVSTTYRAGY